LTRYLAESSQQPLPLEQLWPATWKGKEGRSVINNTSSLLQLTTTPTLLTADTWGVREQAGKETPAEMALVACKEGVYNSCNHQSPKHHHQNGNG